MVIQSTSATQSNASSRRLSGAEDLKLLPAVVGAVKAAAQQIQARFSIASRPASSEELAAALEAAGIAEVILYFNYGQKPHAQVKEQMDRFMREIAPHFTRMPAAA